MMNPLKKRAVIRDSSAGPPMNELIEILIRKELTILDMFKCNN